jgi:Kef-type K+ transport system membrane component KefB/predicted amino acid-binding ACT domain protein
MNLVLLASEGPINFGVVFRDLAVILIVAKLAAEIFERIRIPAVLGEIIAGVIIGPSMMGLVHPTDALRVLAEIGVIVLLAEVGLEMDLGELRRVGRSSILVAIVGVVVPMTSGFFAGTVLGESVNASLFLGSALAATSVGITARVFGDLKALASTEARIVLGAAVADDVLGLIILTVVTRVVEQGSIELSGLLVTIGLACGFLAIAGVIGVLVVPHVFRWIGEKSESPATVGVIAAGITFAFSAAASGAHLAPIIGAFVAGTALGRTSHHDRIARDFQTLGRIFIPVFFLQIGIDTDVTKFFSGHVLLVAGVLSAIAIFGKLVSSVGARGTNTDKLLIGIGMIPRGEVGLIFATIGVSIGVFHEDLYAVVLLMVLITTIITPPLLRWRITNSSDEAQVEILPSDIEEPVGGWIRMIDGEVQLHGNPPTSLLLKIALESALHASHAQPDTRLLDWMYRNRNEVVVWDNETLQMFLELLVRGNARSWRFLEVTNVIDRILPNIAASIRARHSNATELDPTHHVQMPALEEIRRRIGNIDFENASLPLAALILDFDNGSPDSSFLDPMPIPTNVRAEIDSLIAASTLLLTTCKSEPFEPNERVFAQVAAFLGTPLMVERCRQLTEARTSLVEWQFSALLDITTSVQGLLAHPELIEGSENSLEAIRRRDAISLVSDEAVIDRIRHAAAVYVLAHDADVLARHATLVEPAPRARSVRISVHETSQIGEWEIDIATRDMRGLLARICGTLADWGLEIVSADLSTWPDGAVLDSFVVRASSKPNASQLKYELEKRLRKRLDAPRRLARYAELTFDLNNDAHPWHSIVSVQGSDQPGLIQAIATAFARARINVHHARISTSGDDVADRFEVSTRLGRKISQVHIQRLNSLLK